MQCYIQILSPTSWLWGSHYDDEHIFGYFKYSCNINISTQNSRIWQHFNGNGTTPYPQKLTNVPDVPITLLYKYMIDTSEPVHSFTFNKDDDKDQFLMWTILMHPGKYIGTIGMIFTVCIGVYCFKRFWFRPDTPRYWPYSPVLLWHAIVDENVEAAPIYRSGGTVEEPRRLHKNGVLHMKLEHSRVESHCEQPVLSKWVPITGSLAPKHWPLKSKSRECNNQKWLIVRLRIQPVHDRYFLDWGIQWISNSPLVLKHRLATWIDDQVQGDMWWSKF